MNKTKNVAVVLHVATLQRTKRVVWVLHVAGIDRCLGAHFRSCERVFFASLAERWWDRTNLG